MRKSGVLMPISSLSSPWGIGTMGACATEFLQFLHAAGQSVWQVLPVGPTSYGDSPYQSPSSFAGNPYLIDLDILADQGLVDPELYQQMDWGDDPSQVDYGLMYRHRFKVLEVAVAELERVRPADLAAFAKSRRGGWMTTPSLWRSSARRAALHGRSGQMSCVVATRGRLRGRESGCRQGSSCGAVSSSSSLSSGALCVPRRMAWA